MARQIAASIDGFTPLFDVLANQKGGLIKAAVFGRVWRYCQMDKGVCSASQDRIAKELGVSRETVNRHLKALVVDGYLEDMTPFLANHPHQYRDTGKILLSAQITVTQSHTAVTLNHTSVTQSHSHCDLKSHEETDKRRNNLREKDDGANAPIIITPSPDASVADATGKTDFDALARDAGIHNQPAPRKPRKSPVNLTLDTANDERVESYLEILHQDEITPTNAEMIKQRVSRLDLWRETLEMWARGNNGVSYRPTNFGGMFENYDRRVIAAKTPVTVTPLTGKPAPVSYFGEGGVLDQAMNAVWGDMEVSDGN